MPELNAKKIKKIIDEIFSQPLKPNQINLLRAALLETIKIEYKGKSEICQARFEGLNLGIDADTLHRFANNINYYKLGEDFNSSPEKLKIIALYLTHPNINIICVNEIKLGHKTNLQTFLRLAEYFSPKKNLWDIGYSGCFEQTRKVDDLSNFSTQFKLSPQDEYAFFHVLITQLNTFENRNMGTKPVFSSGWGFFIDKDTLFITARKTITERIKNYISVTKPLKDTLGRVENWSLMQANSLMDLNWKASTQQKFNDIQNNSSKNIHLFQRVEKISGSRQGESDMVDKEDVIPKDPVSLEEYREKKLAQDAFDTTRSSQVSSKKIERITTDMDEEELGEQLLLAADELDSERIETLISMKAPVNYRDPRTGNTPFQLSAAYGDWDSLEAFLDTGECNLLCRNDRNRLTSTLAAEGTGNMEWVQKLMDIEKEQGKKAGVLPRIKGDEQLPNPNNDKQSQDSNDDEPSGP